MSMDIMAYVAPGGIEGLVILFASLFAFILPVIIFWKICSKAGFPGALGLLMLLPVGNIILMLYLAFAQWPILKANDRTY
jgi:hypothetical protein